MTTGMPREYEAHELQAALAGVTISEPDAELLELVEDALTRFAVPNDFYPDAAAG